MAEWTRLSLEIGRTAKALIVRTENDRSRDMLIHALEERVKELNCLYGLAGLVETPGITIEGILQGAVKLVSAAWQYPEITSARAVLDDGEYISGEWQQVKSMQTADIVVAATKRGFISVGYIEERPEEQEGPFLREERLLLDTVAERLGRTAERLEIAEVAARSAEQYEDLYDNAPNAYFSVGVDGIIKKANRMASEMLGFDPSGKPVFSLYAETPDGKEKARGIFERFKSGGEINNEELQMQRSDGSVIWVTLSVAPIRDEAGSVIESRSIAVDITDRKTFNKYLEVVKEQWERTFKSVSESIFLINRACTVLQANPALAELLGIPEEEIPGKKCFELIHGVSYAPDSCVTCKALKTGESCSSELYEPTLEKYLSATADPVLGSDGSVEFVIHTLRDITERKEIEEALAKSENLYRTLVETTPDPIFLIDTEGTIISASSASEDLLEAPPEEVLGTSGFSWIVEEDLELVGLKLAEALEAGFVKNVEFTLAGKNGKRTVVEANGALFTGASGTPEGIVIVFRDTTERKAYENRLKRANKELEGFSHTVSHDLRGPLTSLTMSHVLIEEMLRTKAPELMEEASDLMQVCDRSLKRSASLIDDLLLLASMGEPTDTYSIDLNEKIKEVLFERKPELAEKGIEVKVDELGYLVANPTHVYQVFNNLIRNAIRYAVSDDPLIEIRKLEENKYLVRDNGPGISEEIVGEVFVPFVKDGVGDTGLGLSIVERIVQAYGGQIRAYNDDGACFEFTMYDYSGSNSVG